MSKLILKKKIKKIYIYKSKITRGMIVDIK